MLLGCHAVLAAHGAKHGEREVCVEHGGVRECKRVRVRGAWCRWEARCWGATQCWRRSMVSARGRGVWEHDG